MHSCSICKELVDEIVRPKIKSSSSPEDALVGIELVNIGWLDSIVENSNECTLCRLVTRIWNKVSLADGDSGPIVVPDPSKRVYVCFNDGSTTLTGDGTRLHWWITIEFFYPGRNSQKSLPVPTKWAPRFTLLADDFHKIDPTNREVPFMLGRSRRHELQYDAEFLKDCFNTCLMEHGQACSSPVRKFNRRVFPLDSDGDLPLEMRCIDVIGQNIVRIPRDGSCQYAVLSYVWGSSNFLLLTKANYAQLIARGGLRNVRKPCTISDAMKVTMSLGLRYLWVDSLCIIQDDASEKYQQIRKMHKIYASAALTIIAAGANEADNGLWEVIDGTRHPQIEEAVSGLRFVGAEQPLEDVVNDSIWKKRAWTFQEYVLSKRMLVFSRTQAYYSCERGACAEDYVHTITTDRKHDIHYVSSEPEIFLAVHQLSNFPIFWPTLIREYTQRELSFESDGLNAVAGVVASYSVGSKNSFICGLPLNGLFEYSMLWYPSRKVRRRSSLSNEEKFPTWSWVGWVGPISQEDSDDDDDFTAGRIIHHWSLRSPEKTLFYEDGEFSVRYDIMQRNSNVGLSFAQPLKQKGDVDHHLSTIQTCRLSFRTKITKLQFAQSCYTQFVMSTDVNCADTGLYKVFHKENWIGSVHLEHHMAQSLSPNGEQSHDFIALSTNSKGPWYVPERSNPYIGVPDESDWIPLFDRSLAEECNGDDDVYNVMLVTYEDGGVIAVRAGIGQIHKESFDYADSFLKDVQLG